MKKRIVAWLLCLCALLSGVTMLSSCSRAPAVEDIYDRVVELVEASYEINTVFYGAGLPVYKSDSEYAKFTHMYYDFTHEGSYEYVTEYAKFHSESQIRQAAEAVYSRDYLENVIYPATFVGYAIDDSMGDAAFAHARYMEEYDSFYQSTQFESYIEGIRVYDYSTMEIAKPSKEDACYVTMLSWMDHEPEVKTMVRLRLVLQDDGLWYLDSFTG